LTITSVALINSNVAELQCLGQKENSSFTWWMAFAQC